MLKQPSQSFDIQIRIMNILLSISFTDLLQNIVGSLSASVAFASVAIAVRKLFTIRELEGKRKKTITGEKDDILNEKWDRFSEEKANQDLKDLSELYPPSKNTYIKHDYDQGFSNGKRDGRNFENQHLSSYYQQVLYQSKVSFWFSLIFASLGFLMIILSIFLYNEGHLDKSVLSLISGLLIDGVSALFFVQSNKAQKAMGDFFEKLRLDKNNLEARQVCDLIEDKKLRDITKVQLTLKLAEIIPSKELNDKIFNLDS